MRESESGTRNDPSIGGPPMIDPATLTYREDLIPAIIRDRTSGAVLMLGYMNQESLRRTVESAEVWFWSRSRAELWNKGASSGNRQKVVAIAVDCDRDALLIDVLPAGPACHTGAWSCFGDQTEARLNLDPLMSVLRERLAARPEGSYATRLFNGGINRILKKIGEEATEVVLAAKGEGRERLISESADLMFHLSALLVHEGIEWSDIGAELGRREK